MTSNVKESDFNHFTENGISYQVSQVGLPPVVKYSKTATIDSNGTTAPSYTLPFSNVGINIGISIRLSDKKGRRHSEMITDDKKYFKR